jgi:hypothetical protein
LLPEKFKKSQYQSKPNKDFTKKKREGIDKGKEKENA